MKDQNIFIFHSVDDDVFASDKTSQSGTQVLISLSSDVGVSSKKKKPARDGIDHAVGNL